MNCEAIERLAMDWAGGVLSPDVEQLLREHMSYVPEHKAVAQEMFQTYDTIEKAFARRPEALASPCRTKFPSPKGFWGRHAVRAAVVLLAVGIGVWAGRHLAPEKHARMSAPVIDAVVSRPDGVSSTLTDSQDLWARYALAIRDGRGGFAADNTRPDEVQLFFEHR